MTIELGLYYVRETIELGAGRVPLHSVDGPWLIISCAHDCYAKSDINVNEDELFFVRFIDPNGKERDGYIWKTEQRYLKRVTP